MTQVVHPAVAADSLVIAIGNPLRGDDGAAAHVVAGLQLRQGGGPGRLTPAQRTSGWLAAARPELRQVHQLTPELSGDLAAARRVLFVDAWLAPAEAEPLLRRLQPGGSAAATARLGLFSHQLDPCELLAITQLLFGALPEAWELLLPAHQLGHGEGLSAGMGRQLPRARALLQRWCRAEVAAGPDAAAGAPGAAPSIGGEGTGAEAALLGGGDA